MMHGSSMGVQGADMRQGGYLQWESGSDCGDGLGGDSPASGFPAPCGGFDMPVAPVMVMTPDDLWGGSRAGVHALSRAGGDGALDRCLDLHMPLADADQLIDGTPGASPVAERDEENVTEPPGSPLGFRSIGLLPPASPAFDMGSPRKGRSGARSDAGFDGRRAATKRGRDAAPAGGSDNGHPSGPEDDGMVLPPTVKRQRRGYKSIGTPAAGPSPPPGAVDRGSSTASGSASGARARKSRASGARRGGRAAGGAPSPPAHPDPTRVMAPPGQFFDAMNPPPAEVLTKLEELAAALVHSEKRGLFYSAKRLCCNRCRNCFKDQGSGFKRGPLEVRQVMRKLRLQACFDVGMRLRKAGPAGNTTNHKRCNRRRQADGTCAVEARMDALLAIARARQAGLPVPPEYTKSAAFANAGNTNA